MHINVISNLHDPAKFNKTMEFLGTWQFRLVEILLFIAVLYHALNGVRIFIIDFFNGAMYQAKLFWTLMAVAVILFIAGAYPMFSHTIHWKNIQDGNKDHAVISNQDAASLETTYSTEVHHD